MSYVIVDSGNVGKALGSAFARKGIEVVIANRRSVEALAPGSKAIGPTIIARSLKDAVKADVVLLAIPFGTQKDIAKAADNWQGKIVTHAGVRHRGTLACQRTASSFPKLIIYPEYTGGLR
jgi:predicted dinucleotide-binding enzyme